MIDVEMKSIIEEHLDIVRRDAIEAMHSASVALDKFKEIAAEAASADIRVKPSLTMVEAATDLTDKLVSIEAGEWSQS